MLFDGLTTRWRAWLETLPALRAASLVIATEEATEETAASLTEITQSVKQAARDAHSANEAVEATRVEAARAGDSGRGFAVVAQEVRALSQRSADAAKTIKSLIETSGREVKNGVDLVGQTDGALSRITDRVVDVSKLIGSISASTAQQAAALAEVNVAIGEMDRVTQKNAAMVEESTAATQTLSSEVETLSHLVGRFRVGGAPGKGETGASIAQQQSRIAAFAAGRGR